MSFQEYKVDEFTRNTNYKHVIGQNVTFLKVPSFTIATAHFTLWTMAQCTDDLARVNLRL
jgi:hypothetical protein